MEMLSVASISSEPGALQYAPFALDVYLHVNDGHLDTERSNAMSSMGNAETVHDVCN